jgi:hypothetical protein
VAVVLEPPRPKSPPRYPDLCGRRRLQLELQALNREIDFLKVRHRRQDRSLSVILSRPPLTCPN